MSWTDDEIDSIFKEIPQPTPTPFKDSFFDEIEPLLPQKRSRNGLFWVLGSALVALMTTFIHSDLTPAKGQSSAGKQISGGITAQHPVSGMQPALSQSAGTDARPVDPGKITENEPGKANPMTSAQVLKRPARPAQNQAAENTNQQNSLFTSQEELILNPEKALNLMESDLLAINDLPLPAKQHENVNGKQNENENQEEHNGQQAARPEFISLLITSGLTILNPEPFSSDSGKEIQALYLPMLHKKHFLTLEAGAGLTENFIKMENSSQKPMPTASLGLSYQYRTKGLFYSAGLNWMNFSPNSLALTRKSKVYDFNVTSYSQNIDYKWITLLEMPLTVGKRFRNHSFSLGVAPSLVLGSMVDLTQTENGVLTEDSRIYGNMLGLKKYAASVNLAYDLRIARNLDFGVKVSNMLINPLDETRFVGQLNKNPFQAQITLKKHFRIK
jgi:hypothetical protein